MATIAQLAVVLSLDKRNFSSGLQQAQNEASQGQRALTQTTTESIKSLALQANAYYDTAKQVGQALNAIAERGLAVSDVSSAFTSRVGDQEIALERLRSATNGMVSSYDLMTQANIALTLGSAQNIEQFAQMAAVSQKLGRALGVDAAYALNSLNIGISRQSKLILDNLGIMVDIEEANRRYALTVGKSVKELTDQEKAQAFANEAMRQGTIAADAMNISVKSSGMAFLQLKTAMMDSKDAVLEQIDQSVRLQNYYEMLGDQTRTVAHLVKGEFRLAFNDAVNSFLNFTTVLSGKEMKRMFQSYVHEVNNATGATGEFKEEVQELGAIKVPREPINILGFGLELDEEIEILKSSIGEFFEGFRQGGEEVTKLEEAINPLTGALNDYGTASAIIARAEEERRNFLPDLTSAVDGQKNAIQAYTEEVFREISHQEMLNGALKEQISLRQQLSTFRGILGGIAGIAGMFSFLSPVTSFISGASRGLGLFDKLGLFPKDGAPPTAGFSQAMPAASPVVVNLYGPAMSQLVSDITVEQNRAVTYRRVARVA